ncbi:Crp/Fnr family transcriptional regulator [Sphingobium sp. DEHP117]|uniref:Crp/Fnr family transcriptional regulator n=1 Tax=Sphingobium sp. DEHP117 TaxID=2993436 RepID=UPI0027D6D630|nr:helix-turn-helix domain-containing protein [Sphingobium sp. DEHP117]MDQ4420915.1 Crp/Fnr family transcriptional regulator [Sphingobium sp. DEHP117]
MDHCTTCVVRNRAICSALEMDEISLLGKMGRHHKLIAGQTLIWEGEDSLLVANVIEGVLKLSTSLSDGREQIVGVVYPSDFIGRPFGTRVQHNVTALTDAHVCTFSSSDFDRFAQTHPQLEHKLLERTLTELDRTRRWLLLLGRMTASEKLAYFLLDMSQRLVRPDCANEGPIDGFDLPFGRQQIADILGLTIETVSRRLNDFKVQGLIAVPSRRRIEILDREALENITEAA